MPRGAPGCGLLTELVHGLAPPDPQQPIGCQMWALGVAGVVFGGQQPGPTGLGGGRV